MKAPIIKTHLTLLAIMAIANGAVAQPMTDYTGPVFPPNHALNTPIDNLPVHPNSKNFVAGMGENAALHPDFGNSWDDDGTLRQMGIPYNVVGAGQPLVPITFVDYPEESDPGPWPIPQNPYIETVFNWRDDEGGDRHMLIVDSSTHILYETGNVYGNANGTAWEGGCGAIFDLNSYNLRPQTWTSADAAGLPIFPLLIRYDEVERALATGGEIPHPIRFTAVSTQRAFIWPARHYASSSTDPNKPPMGLRFRLKANVDISGFSPRMQVILRTMKKYGLIMSDNGSNWYFQGTHDERWDDEDINTLKRLHGRDFEVVDISAWTSRPGFDPNSARVPDASATTFHDPAGNNSLSNRNLLNSPNPFHYSTIISFNLNAAEKVCLKVFDITGREVIILLNEYLNEGMQMIEWNGQDSHGQSIATGTYVCHLQHQDGRSDFVKIMRF
ncbi:MAG: T9SS type A sorting domain-containing protein [Bacteroidales bacterium]|nr:T9SS type A sorting domain-containing protein [Bacteroidales bacterium]